MNSEKTMAFISYIYLIGLLIAYLNNNQKKSEYVSFHIRQSLGLWLSFFLLGYLVGSFDSWMITISFWVGFAVLIFYGIYTALSGKTIPIPLVGKFYQKYFKSI
ncbi:MAG: hypothetical protein ACON4B_01825 [Flavobacteriaceae bacterium]